MIISVIALSALNITSKVTTVLASPMQDKNEVGINIYIDDSSDKATVHVGQDVPFRIYLYYFGSLNINLNLTFYLEYQGNGSIIMVHSNSSIYLDDAEYVYYNETNILFKSIDKGYWDLWAIAEDKNTGYEYIEKTTFEVIPYEFFLHKSVYTTYVGEPTWIALEILYYEFGSSSIDVEVWIDDFYSNKSIYSDNIVFTGSSPPESYWYDIYHTFEEEGYYRVWLIIQDQGTLEEWAIWCDFKVQWFEIEIIQEYELFVGNVTTIEFNISSSIDYSVYIDLSLYICMWWPYDDFYYNETVYEANNILLDGSVPEESFFNSSISYSFDMKGSYEVVLDVEDASKGINQQKYCSFEVYETIDLRIYQNYEAWVGSTEWIYYEIYYFETYDSFATIELLLDDGNDNITLYYNDNYPFYAQTPYSFNYHYFYGEAEYTFTEKGFYDVHFLCTIHETGETLYFHCWYIVKGKDYDPPMFIEITGLEDGGIYSDKIGITANITDESDFSYVTLQLQNENNTKTFSFKRYITYNITHFLCYATLSLDTSLLYDGNYIATLEAKDTEGNKATRSILNIRLENGNIYVPPDDTHGSDDLISPGFEYITIFLALLPIILVLKHKK